MTRSTKADAPRHPRARGGSNHGRDTPINVVLGMIKSSILNGSSPTGSQLREDALIHSLQASRSTVRAAMATLTEAGYLARQPDVGTTVLPTRITLPWKGLLPPAGHADEVVSTTLPDRILPAPELIRRSLSLRSETVLLRRHLLSLHGRPLGYRVAYRDSLHTGVGTEGESDHLADHFRQVFGCEMGKVCTTIEYAVSDERTSGDLDLPVGSSMLVREQRFFAADGRCLELSFMKVRADTVVFSDS